jgi:hypothetical protein
MGTQAAPTHRLARIDGAGRTWFLVGQMAGNGKWDWSTDADHASPLRQDLAVELELQYNTLPDSMRDGTARAELAERIRRSA